MTKKEISGEAGRKNSGQDPATGLLTGRRVWLRAPEPSDIDLLYRWENDPAAWTVSHTVTPYSRLAIEEFVMNTQYDLFTARQLRLMIAPKRSRQGMSAIGAIDLFDFDPVNRRAGTGILIDPAYRSKGYALEAMEIFIRYAFLKLPVHQLHCGILPGNEASLRLFRKLGFTRCGIRRDWIRHEHGWLDEWVFQLINPYE